MRNGALTWLMLPVLVLVGAPAMLFGTFGILNLWGGAGWTLGFLAVGGLALGGAIVDKEFHFKQHVKGIGLGFALPWCIIFLITAPFR